MSTLSGKRIKDTYESLLKTNDDAGVTSSLKVIEDGAGTDTALSLSTTTVKASALEIESIPSGSSSSNAMVWNATSKAVEYRTFPTVESVSTTVGGSTSPTVTITDAGGTATTVTFAAQDGVGLTRSGNTITISGSTSNLNLQETGVGSAALSSPGWYAVDGTSTTSITLPTPIAGSRVRLLLTKSPTTDLVINTKTSSQYVAGAVTVTSTTSDKTSAQVVAETGTGTSVTLNGSSATKGGTVGNVIDLIAVSSSLWMVNASLTTTNVAPSSTTIIDNP